MFLSEFLIRTSTLSIQFHSSILIKILNERSIEVYLFESHTHIHMLAHVHRKAVSNSKCDQQAILGSFSLSCLDNGFILKDAVVKRCMRYFNSRRDKRDFLRD